MTAPVKIGSRLYFSRAALEDVVQVLRKQGYSVLGPRLVDGTIALHSISKLGRQLGSMMCSPSPGSSPRRWNFR